MHETRRDRAGGTSDSRRLNKRLKSPERSDMKRAALNRGNVVNWTSSGPWGLDKNRLLVVPVKVFALGSSQSHRGPKPQPGVVGQLHFRVQRQR